jgi:hypothetical protein
MDHVVVLPGFYTKEECEDELAYASKAGFLIQQYGSHDRKRAFIDDRSRAKQIYEKLKVQIPPLEMFYLGLKPDPPEEIAGWKPVGLNYRLRYYKYEIGQLFSRHFDILYRINDNTRTFLTFIAYLNDEFEGGQTIFDETVVIPKMGDAILFPHELKHEGATVTKGCKIILRSDVVYQR